MFLNQEDIDGFTVVKQISSGSRYDIFQVIEKDTNKNFVFKMLKTSLSDQDDNSYMQARLNFRNTIKEIEMLSRFNSSLIVKFHGACLCYKYKNSETFVNVLEYCQNGSLINYIGKDNNIFNDTRKLNCIYGIASGMRYLHSHQFIHRNLNPRKILLDDRFIPKINDLSLAAIIDEKIVTMTIQVGIFAYMAPEMFKEDGIYSYPVDVYSFGIMVHEILTGKLPFDGGFLEFFDFLKSGEKIKFSDSVPKCYQDLISKCLLYDPAERPTFDEIVKLLKTDKSFILENVDEDEFRIFCDFIEAPNSDESIPPSRIEIDESEMIQKLEVNIEPIDLKLFEKEELVGKGSFGKVYKVVDIRTNEKYAAKVSILDLTICDQYLFKNLSNEINILSKLNAHSILKFVGYNSNDFKDKPKPTIITEFARNGSLYFAIEQERKGLSIDGWNNTKKLINIFGIAYGMSYLHSLNILHRDLKLANILLDDSLYPKIGDFGLSIEIQNDSKIIEFAGTLLYMSP